MKMQSPKMEEKEQRKRPLMKAAQLLEFQMQTLVYRYIEAGLHVPQHLMVPIWNSLAFSSSMLSSNKGLNHIDMVKPPEPIRCRRTDGKKWRCGNTVLPFEKYCERHMHRGCKRSRKLVESSNEVGLDKNSVSQIGTVSVSCNDQAVTIASYPSARACDSVTHPSLLFSESTKKSDKSRRNMESSMCVRVAPVRGDESLPSGRKLFPEASDKSLEAAKISSNNDESLPACQKFFPEVCDNSLEAAKMSSNKKNDIIARSREWKNVNVNGSLFPSIHFSPDTVLQDRGGFHLHRVETDNEPGRCRRTDGKKWRCSKDALSGQKYCDKHMHRGSNKKKHQLDTKSHENATAKTTAGFVSCKGDDDDQKLSVTVMGISLPRVSDEKTTRSCSTETTITDTALRGEEDNEGLSLCSSGV